MSYSLKVKEDKIKEIPAVTHVDNTCRIQTVKRIDNPHYHKLISEFYIRTGVPLLLNTSFNLVENHGRNSRGCFTYSKIQQFHTFTFLKLIC